MYTILKNSRIQATTTNYELALTHYHNACNSQAAIVVQILDDSYACIKEYRPSKEPSQCDCDACRVNYPWLCVKL